MRRGISLIELIVCLGIIAIMVSMMFPAIQKLRATANVSACQNNMRQISLGIHMYHDQHHHLPYPRICPAPWQGGKDPLCTKLSSPAEYTGPDELWWCPYDNRPGTTVTAALSESERRGDFSDFAGRELGTAVTDRDGRYEFDRLAPGIYRAAEIPLVAVLLVGAAVLRGLPQTPRDHIGAGPSPGCREPVK